VLGSSFTAGLSVGSSMMMQPNGAGRGVDLGSLSTRKGLAWSSEQLAALLNCRAEVVGFTGQGSSSHPLSAEVPPLTEPMSDCSTSQAWATSPRWSAQMSWHRAFAAVGVALPRPVYSSTWTIHITRRP
jgi:hypothetical protein